MKSEKMKNRKNRIFLMLLILLLTFSFVSTPITALASSKDDSTKEPPITTSGEDFYIEEEIPTEEWFGEESAASGTTRGNDEIVNTTYLEDGVYAFRNIGNGNLWMDLQQNIIGSSAHIQQCYYATPPTELFERAALFKVTRIGATNRYIIRLMMNNLLTFDFVLPNDEGISYVKTKRIPANDSEVNPVDTFIIIKTELGYTIGPADTSYSVCANNTAASGAAGAPDSYLIKSTVAKSGNCAKWEIHKYTGVARSGYSAGASPSFTNGLAVGNTSTITMYSWSTTVGANKPSIEVSSAFSSRVSVTDTTTSSGFSGKFKLSALKAGRFELIYSRKNASNTSLYPSYQMYMAIPDFDTDTFYIQNGATGMYMDVEEPSTSVGAYIQQWSFSTAPKKQWIITPTSGGYYTIQSKYSNLYVGVDSSNTSLVKQYSTLNDYTKWYFYETTSGRYAIDCKSSNVSGSLAVPTDTSGAGVNLTTSIYTNNSSFRDEWVLDSAAYEYIFCGIPDLAHAGHDHSSVLFDTHDKVIDAYQNSLDIDVQVYDTELSTSSCLQYLKDAAVFTSRGHGGFHPNSDGSVKCTLIILGTASVMYSHTHTSSTQDQYIISSSDDFSQLDLAVFAGCNTGAGGVGANNLPTKAVECGARVAIGFEGSIGCDAANTWTRVFYESLLAGKTVNVAVANANRESGLVTTVCGDGTYCLP